MRKKFFYKNCLYIRCCKIWKNKEKFVNWGHKMQVFAKRSRFRRRSGDFMKIWHNSRSKLILLVDVTLIMSVIRLLLFIQISAKKFKRWFGLPRQPITRGVIFALSQSEARIRLAPDPANSTTARQFLPYSTLF